MDYRPPPGAPRPAPPQRAVSGGSYGGGGGGHALPPLPSHLSSVRSVSQPSNIVDLTAEGMQAEGSRSVLGTRGKEEVVQSPEVIDLEGDAERPAKRAKTAGEEFQAAEEHVQVDDVDKAHEVLPGAALPNLPRARPSAGRMSAYRRNRFGIEPSARKANGLNPPAIATRVPHPKKVLDFAPWSGSHPEDVLNENMIRNGYFDKVAGSNQSETNTAKASIWPSLSQKNHAGLSALSYMYIAVMEKRQTLGKCAAPSTFKPPPRLAVQEAKRAKWLEDLADASVSLRRLSKTIPHGIKGKLLMEQCLGKFIPLHRAMWLVRGVGMHELRAFRRKGFNEAQAVSGEIKWIREWTVNVTQFLEDVMAACGQADWQRKMNYAVKLATALYSERLLDVDYYLDWIVSSLAESTSERLPIWIILTQIHWKDLITFGRSGRKMAEAILEHLRVFQTTGSAASAAVRDSLQRLVTVLAVTNRGCLVMPRTWQRYKDLLSPAPSTGESAINNVVRRNERLAAPFTKTSENTRSAYSDLYDALDSVGLMFDFSALTEQCIGYIPDPAKLIPALLDWAATRYRTGPSRIYVAAAIIARVQGAGHDTDSIILQYLGAAQNAGESSEENVHSVVVELVSLHAFSVGRYLQWLIASGALYGEQRTSATRLITALPTDGLPKHVMNTRRMLMDRLGHTVDESRAVQSFIGEVEKYLFDDSDVLLLRGLELPKSFSKCAAHNVAQELVQRAGQLAKDPGLSLRQFCIIRFLLEQMGDMPSLQSLVSTAASSDIGALLATAGDTVNYHAASLAALQQLIPIVDQLSEQYLALRPHQPLDRSFILALLGLVKHLPEKASMMKLLADDLVLCEQQTSVAACSPASDSLIDMHATKLDSDEDIDAVFESGNVMDEQLMQRVFSRIVQRASKPVAGRTLTRVCGWLDQLRMVDASRVLEVTVDKFLQGMLNSGLGKALMPVVAALTLSGCSSLARIASMAKDVKDPASAESLLAVFISPTDDLGLEDAGRYRFKLEQTHCQDEHASEIVQLLRTSLGSTTFDSQNDDIVRFVVKSRTTQDNLHELFADASATETVQQNGRQLLNAVLGLPSGGSIDITRVIDAATPLSIRFSTAIKHLATTGEPASSRDAILRAFEEHSEVWPQLLQIAGGDTIRALRERAQDVLLQPNADSEVAPKEEELGRTLDLLAITGNMSQKPDVAFLSVVVDRLKDMERQLSDQTTAQPAARRGVLRKLDLLLRLATPSIHAVDGESDAAQQTRANLLHVLCVLLVHQELQLHRNVLEYIFDLASVLSDSLTETTVAALKTKLPADARLDCILGGSFNVREAWLALATQVPPASAGATQQQRALNKHSSQQQQLQPQKNAPRPGPSIASPAQQRGWLGPVGSNNGRAPAEVKTTPFQLRRWEIISDPASTVGDNDTALSLGLFGMRKV